MVRKKGKGKGMFDGFDVGDMGGDFGGMGGNFGMGNLGDIGFRADDFSFEGEVEPDIDRFEDEVEDEPLLISQNFESIVPNVLETVGQVNIGEIEETEADELDKSAKSIRRRRFGTKFERERFDALEDGGTAPLNPEEQVNFSRGRNLRGDL